MGPTSFKDQSGWFEPIGKAITLNYEPRLWRGFFMGKED
jgi:hypothetical protein